MNLHQRGDATFLDDNWLQKIDGSSERSHGVCVPVGHGRQMRAQSPPGNASKRFVDVTASGLSLPTLKKSIGETSRLKTDGSRNSTAVA